MGLVLDLKLPAMLLPASAWGGWTEQSSSLGTGSPEAGRLNAHHGQTVLQHGAESGWLTQWKRCKRVHCQQIAG